MGKNRAISIGINRYDDLTPLKYAKRDAELMKDFFHSQAGFEQVLFFSDDSPDFKGRSTHPSFTNLNKVLRTMFENPLEAGDNFWFFFSGHGMRHNGCDYLMASNSDPKDIERTGIPISYVTEQLRRCGADNVILILDACRDLGTKSGQGIGNQAAQVAREKGVVTFFSCSPNQLSYEIEALQQGVFTKAVLEGLGIRGRCATVGQLNSYLSARVPELICEHKREKVRQIPYCVAEPIAKSHLIILPQNAKSNDIYALKIDALHAEVEKNFELAEQLWIRVLAASYGSDASYGGDMDAIKGIQRIAVLRSANKASSQDNSVSAINNPVSAIERGDEEENLVSDFELSEEEEAIGDFDMDDDDEEAEVFDLDMDDDDEEAVSDFDLDDLDLGDPPDEEEVAVSNSNAKRSESLLSSKSLPVTNPIPTEADVPLKSERGIDYTNLRDLLAAKKWKEADEETARVMLKVAGREKEGWLDSESIDNFSCEDLRTINQLWIQSSNGRFGFSVQKHIYQSLGGTSKYDEKVWEKFGDRVGWRIANNLWLYYSNLTFSEKAPEAHLPCSGVGGRYVSWWLGYWEEGFLSLFSRVETCNVNNTITEPDVPLKSEREIDYTKLRDLLATKKWAEADNETHGIMLLIAGKEKVGYFDIMDIQKHFCEDFRIINQLWLEYSNGRFGFSVQKCIRDEIKENLYKFLDRVGWDLDWGTCGYGGTRQTFPKGNFPARWFFSWYASVGEDLGMARIHGTEDMLWISLDCF